MSATQKLYTKTVAIAFLRKKLANSEAWALRGLQVIFDRQTADEQAVNKTKESNGIGFTGIDAEFLTSLAKNARKYGSLTPRQVPHLLRKMPKYAAQILSASEPEKLYAAMKKEGVI